MCVCQDATKEDTWDPLMWRRNNMLFATIIMCGFCVCLLEFSFWDAFGDNIWTIILTLKAVELVVGLVVESQLHEGLLHIPLSIAFGLTESVMTLSANNFLDFLLSYIVSFGFIFLSRMYVGPYFGPFYDYVRYQARRLLDKVTEKLPRWLIAKKPLPKAEQAAADAAAAEGKKRSVQGFGGRENQTVEPILEYLADYSSETIQLLYSPVIILLLIIFRDETGMPALYNIRQQDMTFYLIFALVIILFQYCADVFIHGAIENFHGWKVYDYLVYTRYRFLQREARWKGMEDTLDECIEDSLRTLDQMCFSSQYYMMMAMYVNGMVFILLGLEMMIRNDYNLWSDPAFYIIFTYTLIMAYVAEKLILFLANQVRSTPPPPAARQPLWWCLC